MYLGSTTFKYLLQIHPLGHLIWKDILFIPYIRNSALKSIETVLDGIHHWLV